MDDKIGGNILICRVCGQKPYDRKGSSGYCTHYAQISCSGCLITVSDSRELNHGNPSGLNDRVREKWNIVMRKRR